MRFPMPNFRCEFEILDEWWIEAGMPSFTRHRPAYRSTTTNIVGLDDIGRHTDGCAHRVIGIAFAATACCRS